MDSRNSLRLPKLITNWNDYVIYYVFIVIFLVFAILLSDKGFISGGNLLNIGRQTAIIAVLAIGVTFVLSSGEIDLSFASVVALSAVVTAIVLRETSFIPLSLAAGLSCGLLIGLLNGFLVAIIRLPSFLVTLGMAGIASGLARWISNLRSIPANNDTFTFIFGSGDIGPLPILFLWVIGIGLLGHIALKKTPFGRRVLATGGNSTAALYSGINTARVKIQVLLISGLLASLGGILYTGRLQSGRYDSGENDLLIVIAAVIIGGTSLFGGKGSIIGSIVGAIIMGMLNNGLILRGLSVDQQLIFRGLIIIIAVSLATREFKK